MTNPYIVWDETSIPPNLLWSYLGVNPEVESNLVKCIHQHCNGVLDIYQTINGNWYVNCSKCQFSGSPLSYAKEVIPELRSKYNKKKLIKWIRRTQGINLTNLDLLNNNRLHKLKSFLKDRVTVNRHVTEEFTDAAAALGCQGATFLKSCWAMLDDNDSVYIHKALKDITVADRKNFRFLLNTKPKMFMPMYEDGYDHLVGGWIFDQLNNKFFIGVKEFNGGVTTAAGFPIKREGKIVLTLDPVKALKVNTAGVYKNVVPIRGSAKNIQRLVTSWGAEFAVTGKVTPSVINLARRLNCGIIPDKYPPEFKYALDWKGVLANYVNNTSISEWKSFIDKCGSNRVLDEIMSLLKPAAIKDIKRTYRDIDNVITLKKSKLIKAGNRWLLDKTGEVVMNFDVKVLNTEKINNKIQYKVKVSVNKQNDLYYYVPTKQFRDDVLGCVEHIVIASNLDCVVKVDPRVTNKTLKTVAFRDQLPLMFE